MDFLDAKSPGAFLDWPPAICPVADSGEVVCPVCLGRGGWNLSPYEYRLPAGEENTPANRHLYVHFRCFCSQCSGRGLVTAADATCIHDMKHERRLGNCWNLYKCTKCGRLREIDSSD